MKNTLAEHKILLRELVDKVSVLGDQKDFGNQVQLFTEDAISETRSEGRVILELKGREVMKNAFAEFIACFFQRHLQIPVFWPVLQLMFRRLIIV